MEPWWNEMRGIRIAAPQDAFLLIDVDDQCQRLFDSGASYCFLFLLNNEGDDAWHGIVCLSVFETPFPSSIISFFFSSVICGLIKSLD